MTTLPTTIPATATDLPADFTVVARTPAQMADAQRHLIAWAERKIAVEEELKSEADDEAAKVKAAGWDDKAWRRRAFISGRRIAFYQKIRAALEAGYYIVPPFPVELFAIRTNRENPRRKENDYKFANFEQAPAALPQGEGRYVSPVPLISHRSWQEQNREKTGLVTKNHYWASKFAAVEFPFKLAKGAVMQSVTEAMALKLFDQLGVLPRVNAPDPIVVGQLIDPQRPQGPHLTFFVAWWLDTSTL